LVSTFFHLSKRQEAQYGSSLGCSIRWLMRDCRTAAQPGARPVLRPLKSFIDEGPGQGSQGAAKGRRSRTASGRRFAAGDA